MTYLEYLGIIFLSGTLFVFSIYIASLTNIFRGSENWIAKFFALIVLMLVYFFTHALLGSYFVAMFQNLIWNATHAPGVQIVSRLSAWGLFKIYFVNIALTSLTLGFYWPFAAMRTAHYRASSLTLVTSLPLALFAAQSMTDSQERNALGDAVGDVFGIDIAL